MRVSSPQGRFADGSRKLDGRKLLRVESDGKHLFYHWQDKLILHIHLGLYGKFRVSDLEDGSPPPPRGLVRLRMIGRKVAIDLNGPTICSLCTAAERRSILARLGPDPLRRGADPAKAWKRIHGTSRAIGALLLDQSIIAGIGNIYRAEVLFLIGVHPLTPGKDLTRSQFQKMWRLLQKLFRRGVKYNRLITTEPADVGRSFGKMRQEDRYYIARRKTCRRCGAAVQTIKLAGRKMYFCPHCQPRPL